MRPFSTGQTYLNFHFAQDAAPEQVRAALDPKTYNRLAGRKKQFDPTNMFGLNHNIPPA